MSIHPLLRPLALFWLSPLALAVSAVTAMAQDVPLEPSLGEVVVNASADASAEGLSKPFSGGMVARGARVGILGTQDFMETPFQITSYTQELIANQQAQSVADMLRNAASVRQARGFGNFQEVYVVRGYPLYSDDIAYNGLYGMLPRQYVASQFFERVEVLLGANAFLNGAAPGGSALGGSVNLLPKRAGAEPLTQVSAGVESGGQGFVAADISRRFGPDQSTGVRLNMAQRNGDTAIDRESRKLGMLGLGVDWRSSSVRVSADLGYQDNDLRVGRAQVTPAAGLPTPAVPGRTGNYSQPWTYSKEKDLFGTVRAEWDISDDVTAWAAGGVRAGEERNVLTGLTLQDAAGNATTSPFDNHRKDNIRTAEVGVRAKFSTGSIGHQLVASMNSYSGTERNAYGMAAGTSTNLYRPVDVARGTQYLWSGGDLNDPSRVGVIKTRSLALADTLSFMDGRLLPTVGLRYQKIEQSGFDYSTRELTSQYDKSRVTPMAGVVFKLQPSLSVYASYVEGLQKGETAPASANGLPVLNGGALLQPMRTRQKEVGLKWEQGDIGASAAYFISDKPTSYVRDQVFAENGKERRQGVELHVFGQPLKGLRVLGGVTFLDAKQKQTEGGLLDGKRVIGVPRQQASLGVDWDVPGVRGLALNAQLLYTGSQWADGANTQKVAAWTRTDLGVRYLMPMGDSRLLTLRANLANAFDRNYWASVGGFPGANYLVQSTPRTLAVSATVDF
ncbi:MAG: TonB-dependent receptor [Burkholderiaceae bacterium]|nr:TonB-dependent receptor [Burkholderiaceae bacterium]